MPSPSPTAPHATPPEPTGLDADLVFDNENLEEEEGPKLGGTPRGLAANRALLALSRACRSFVLYDPANEAIRKFLANLQNKMNLALEGFGDLTLTVRPFELLLESEVVYLERDRERSLAFRLYKDGIRKLQIDSRVTWNELLKLLEVMSVRTSVSAAQEDDLITLLRKASFHSIKFEAAENFVLEDGLALEGLGSAGTAVARSHVEAPADWDQPLPEFGAPSLLIWRPVTDDAIASLRAETNPGALAGMCAQVVLGLVDAVADPTDPMALEDLLPMASEVRDFLLLKGDADGLSVLVEATRRVDTGEAVTSLFGTPEVFRRILELLLREEGHAALEYHLLPCFPELVVEATLARLQAEPGGPATPTLLGLLRQFVAAHPEPLLRAMMEGAPALVQDLVETVGEVLPDRVYALGLSLVKRSEPEIARCALRMLRTQPLGPALVPELMPLLRSAAPDVRQSGVELIGRIGNPDTFRALEATVQTRAGGRDLSGDEAEAWGQAMARMAPALARPLFTDWLRPKRLFNRLIQAAVPPLRLRVAVAGLGTLPGDDVEGVLREALPQADEALRRAIFAALARRRARGVTHG